MNPEPAAAHAQDALLELELLELRIARRADELTRTQAQAGSLNLHCWLVAEYEVLMRDDQLSAHGPPRSPCP